MKQPTTRLTPLFALLAMALIIFAVVGALVITQSSKDLEIKLSLREFSLKALQPNTIP
jgi:hypothetical protein